MKRMKKRFKENLALFLAFCMMITSFPSITFAKTESGKQDMLIELSGTKIREEAEAAIRSGKLYNALLAFQELNITEDKNGEEKTKLVDSELYGSVFDHSTGSIFQLENIPYVNKASASDAMRKDAEMLMFVKLNGQAAEAASGSSAIKASSSDAQAASGSNAAIVTQNYELTGEEQIIFLFINRSDEDLTFQLDIDGRKSAVVLVESKSALLAEEEKEEVQETPAVEEPSVEEGPAGEGPAGESGGSSVSGSGSSGGGTQTEDNTQTGDDIQTEDNTQSGDDVQTEDNTQGGDDVQTEDNTQSGDDVQTEDNTQSGDDVQTEDNTQSGDDVQTEDNTQSGDDVQTEDNTQSSDDVQTEDNTQSGDDVKTDDNTQSSDDVKADNNTQSGDNGQAENEKSEQSGNDSKGEDKNQSSSGSNSDGTDSGSSENNSSESNSGSASGSDGVQVSISSHKVNLVMASADGKVFVPQDSYDDDDENAPKNPEEEFEMMYGDEDDEEEEPEEESSYMDDVEIYGNSLDGVDIPTVIYPTVLIKKESLKARFFRSAVAAPSAGQVSGTAGVISVTYSDIAGNQEVNFNDFRVNLYKYTPNTVNNLVGVPTQNAQLTNKFLINQSLGYNLQNTWLPYAFGGSTAIGSEYDPVSFQGIMADKYGNDGKITLSSKYSVGNLSKVSKLFPDETSNLNGVNATTGVEIGEGVFQRAGNYYVLNSIHEDFQNASDYKGHSTSVTLKGNTLTGEEVAGSNQKGFFPYGNNNFSFGMKLSFDFNLPSDGMAGDNEPMTFSFAGDDDVWVYIRKSSDDEKNTVLAMDLGGIHGLTKGTIDFSTGIIKHADVLTDTKGAHGEVNWYLYTEADLQADKKLTNAQKRNVVKCVGLEKPEGFSDIYTIDFYYMERGAGYSNCYMDFNMPIIPAKGVKIQKKVQGEMPDNSTFKFKVVSADTEKKLEEYQNGTDSGDVTVQFVTINGAGEAAVELDAGQYFYVEETDSQSAGEIQWNVAGSSAFQPVSGKSTDIYQVTRESQGFLIQCTNVFGKLSPDVAKKAWKDYNADDEYDVSLEVVGDSMTTTSVVGGNAANVVFVLDKSSSMNNYYKGVKEQVNNLIDGLGEESYVSVVTFAAKNQNQANYYYDEAPEDYYYDTLAGWTYLKTSQNTLKDTVSKDKTSSGTHSAAGFLGALHKLRKLPSEAQNNPSYVIYLTDGDPYFGLEKDSRGRIVRLTNHGSQKERMVAAAQYVLGKLKSEFNDTHVYTIAYRTTSNQWLRTSAGVEKYFEAGDTAELEEILKSITTEINSTIKVTNPKVTDTLSEHVAPVGIEINGQSIAAPELYYGNASVTGTSVNGPAAAADKGEKLTASVNPEDFASIIYTDSAGKLIATYNVSAKTIVWNVADSLGKNEKRVLTYRVKVTGVYTADYPNTGGRDTGTHSSENGYNSNESAVLTYESGTDMEFPHPVVQVTPSKLTVSKTVTGADSNDALNGKYYFSVRFEDGKQFTTPEGAVWQNGRYVFTLNAGESLEFTNLPKGTTYTVEETGSEISNDNYVLTGISVTGTGTAETGSTNSRPENLSTTGTVMKGGSEADFTNTYSKYGYITVVKRLGGDESAYPETSPFRFTMSPANTDTGTYDASFELSADGQKQIRIEPEDREKEFTITETDSQNAWKTTVKKGSSSEEANSIAVKSGDTATFTNYYYKHDITLSKQISGENSVPDKAYKFDVFLKVKAGATLTLSDVLLTRGENTENPAALTVLSEGNYDYKFTVELKADESVTIAKLPQSVTGYKVTEDLTGDTGNYKSQIAHVTWNTVEQPEKLVEKTFSNDESQSDTIVFTNQFIRTMGKLQITKVIVKDTGMEPVKAKEDLTFTFKITNKDSGEYFYTTVKVEKGNKTAETVLTVPTGTYTIEELPNLQYQAVGSTEQTVVVPEGETLTEGAKSIFHNYKSGNGYFTDVSVVTNKVDKDGFNPDGEQKKTTALPAAILPDDKSTKKDQDSDDN